MGHESPTLIVCFLCSHDWNGAQRLNDWNVWNSSRCIPLRRVRLTVNSLYIYERRTRQASSAEPQRRGN